MPRIRILIAEDEVMTRCLLAGRLAHEAGFEVVGEAEDGRAAVELARERRPDVVVMDLNLPGINGVQATERILEHAPHTRVIMLTALGPLASVARAAGAWACLDKGVTPEELIRTIHRAYGAPRPLPDATRASDYHEATARLAERAGLTAREGAVLLKLVETELTIQQIARQLSIELGEAVTPSSVKHARERVMTKLRVDPATRSALVKRVLESDPGR